MNCVGMKQLRWGDKHQAAVASVLGVPPGDSADLEQPPRMKEMRQEK